MRQKQHPLLVWILPVCLLMAADSQAAGFLDKLFGNSGTNTSNRASSSAVAGLSNDQVAGALKQALSSGVQHAITELGHEGGFLANLNVRIVMPEKLRATEKVLRSLKQDKLVDDFEATMNHAAEQAVPQAAEVFTDAIRQMTLVDAKNLLTGSTNAITEYFRKTTSTNLHARFLPIVKEATAKTGVTSTYKKITERVGAEDRFGGFGRALLGNEAMDLDQYVTDRSLDGLFKMIAEEEKRIRENPVARTSDLLQKVFGAVKPK